MLTKCIRVLYNNLLSSYSRKKRINRKCEYEINHFNRISTEFLILLSGNASSVRETIGTVDKKQSLYGELYYCPCWLNRKISLFWGNWLIIPTNIPTLAHSIKTKKNKSLQISYAYKCGSGLTEGLLIIRIRDI